MLKGISESKQPLAFEAIEGSIFKILDAVEVLITET